MHALSVIKRQNNQTEHDEKVRLRTNYTVQESGEVWVRHDGKLKIAPKEKGEAFLAKIKGWTDAGIAAVIVRDFFPAQA